VRRSGGEREEGRSSGGGRGCVEAGGGKEKHGHGRGCVKAGGGKEKHGRGGRKWGKIGSDC
jgi:hypothetical protein